MQRNRIRVVALVTLLSAASLAAQPRRELLVRLTEVPQGIRLDTIGRVEKIGAPLERTFDAVRKAYAEFEIGTNTESVQHGEIGNTALALRRRFAGERVSKSLDCGRGMAGDYADQYRISVAVVTWVSPRESAADSSTVHTALVGGGRATDGATAWPLQCASLGYFERKLAKRVRELAAAP
jgi:hypothetical protein